jgi:hypothetical protein
MDANKPRPARTLMAMTVLLLLGENAIGCEKLSLVVPSVSTLSVAQPILEWKTAGEKTYRVQVSLQVPEQGIYASYDTQTQAGRWQIPAAVASPLTAVKVLISADCPQLNAQDLAVPSFFIDLRKSCEVFSGSWRQQDGVIRWQASADATQFVVRRYELKKSDTNLPLPVTTQLATEPFFRFPVASCATEDAQVILSVQPVCSGLQGRAVAYAACSKN